MDVLMRSASDPLHHPALRINDRGRDVAARGADRAPVIVCRPRLQGDRVADMRGALGSSSLVHRPKDRLARDGARR
eukprot:5480054-Alexandrium_andersonii.AAC.1